MPSAISIAPKLSLGNSYPRCSCNLTNIMNHAWGFGAGAIDAIGDVCSHDAVMRCGGFKARSTIGHELRRIAHGVGYARNSDIEGALMESC